jgi:serine/threonine protein kinase
MSDLTGKTLSQYQIVERLQDTGSALIYKGFQPNMNRYVLVEVLKSHDPAAVQAFNQQSELLAQIQHPNILPIYDSGQAEGLNYRAMRYAEGGVLPDHLLPYYDPGKAAGFLSGVVAGLAQIHAHGWVHGNLAPENIYLDENGQPLLTDFGIPRPAGAPVTSYLSPEQVQGDIVDQRSDIYALGVLLYTLLIGETPPAGVVVSPRAKRPDLPAAVEKVIFKAMAQNPEARFQSAREFQTALTGALRPIVPAQTAVAQPSTVSSGPPPPVRRGTNWAAIILGVILVVVICGGVFLIFNWWSNRPVDTVPGEPVEPPVEIIPTAIPEEPEQPIEPPEEPQPPEPPEGGNPPQLPEICNSAGFAGGFFLLGSVLIIRNRSGFKKKNSPE